MNTRKTAVVTGASGGIGLEMAKLLAADQYDLVLVARGEAQLRQVADALAREHQITTHVVAIDLSKAGAAEHVAELVEEKGLSIDVLVNNAGYGVYGPFGETDTDAELGMIQLNVAALTHLTKLLLPQMLVRKSGRILNVASTAAFQPVPLMAAYGATKAYVLSFSEALANELVGTGVSVTALCPGVTRTSFLARARMEESKLARGKGMSPETVARAAYQALMRGKRVIVPGFGNKVLTQTPRFLPRKTVAAFARSVMERAPGTRRLPTPIPGASS